MPFPELVFGRSCLRRAESHYAAAYDAMTMLTERMPIPPTVGSTEEDGWTLGRLDTAKASFAKAVELDPSHEYALFTRRS